MTKRGPYRRSYANPDAMRHERANRRFVAAKIAFDRAYKQGALTSELCRELAQSKAALRLAHSVHVSTQENGD